MSVKDTTADELRRMKGEEGIIFQGCGGEVKEWIDGINEMLDNAGILIDGTRLEDVARFEHDGLTNILFKFGKDDKIDIGKFAMWRLQTHSQFGGTWLSDYVPNRLGGFIDSESETKQPDREKTDCPLVGQDGNVFGLVGIASRTLKRKGMRDEANEMSKRVFSSGSYDEALSIIGEYVNITSSDDMREESRFEINM